jgi:hypothetical protein
VHQVSLKDSKSQNFSFLDFKGEVVGVTQISSYNGNGAGQTEIFLSLKSCKKRKSAKKFFQLKSICRPFILFPNFGPMA